MGEWTGNKTEIFIFAPSDLMIASLMAYPQYGACRYYFDGQILRLLHG